MRHDTSKGDRRCPLGAGAMSGEGRPAVGRSRQLSGKELAADIRARVGEAAAELAEAGTVPRLAVVLATADGRSTVVGKPVAHLPLDRDARHGVPLPHPVPRRARSASRRAGRGGVDPVTTALLLEHTVRAAVEASP
jgi:5,10-methylene-tetrahydrofolate dehydrogenase/methenyl tetrahydrofolate cyclohydrolase